LEASIGLSTFKDIFTVHDYALIHTILIRGGVVLTLPVEWEALWL
jgi:hypothetical protein